MNIRTEQTLLNIPNLVARKIKNDTFCRKFRNIHERILVVRKLFKCYEKKIIYIDDK